MTSADINDESNKAPLLTINNTPIHFSQDWNTGIGGGLWSTGWAMAKYFECHSDDITNCLFRLAKLKRLQSGVTSHLTNETEGISAMELGSGNGFLSVCLLAAVANKAVKKLVVTDMSDHLGLIQNTLDANTHVVNQCSADVSVSEHKWGCFEAEENKYDFIFGTDLAYREYLYEPLISSLMHFSHDCTVSLIGVTMNDTRAEFFDRLREAGFRYERLADHLMEGEFQSCTNFGVFAIQKQRK